MREVAWLHRRGVHVVCVQYPADGSIVMMSDTLAVRAMKGPCYARAKRYGERRAFMVTPTPAICPRLAVWMIASLLGYKGAVPDTSRELRQLEKLWGYKLPLAPPPLTERLPNRRRRG